MELPKISTSPIHTVLSNRFNTVDSHFGFDGRYLDIILVKVVYFSSEMRKNLINNIRFAFRIRIEESRAREVDSIKGFSMLSNNTATGLEMHDTKWSTDTHTIICGGIIASLFVTAVARSIMFYKFFATASQNLHDMMFRGLIATKMRFFDTNASGRILNRFSKDMGSVDEGLPKVLLDAIQINLLMIGAICVTVYSNIEFSILILILTVLFFIARNVYLKCSTNIKRLEGMSKQTHSIFFVSTMKIF